MHNNNFSFYKIIN